MKRKKIARNHIFDGALIDLVGFGFNILPLIPLYTKSLRRRADFDRG